MSLSPEANNAIAEKFFDSVWNKGDYLPSPELGGKKALKAALRQIHEGVVDLLAILPTYLSLVFPGSQYLLVIRILRVLRIFRVLKLVQFIDEAQVMMRALKASRRKIAVFFATVITLVVIFGSVMYVIEPAEAGFTSIPRAVYWAVVTMTTVGYGDISPVTAMGQTIAAFIMLIGFTIIAVPTGIVTTELAHLSLNRPVSTQAAMWPARPVKRKTQSMP